ncbi:MAG: hypothetical protein GY947_15720 [Rhodobacteraceae bacterium]|nr:hypothetical protein [Paracoccaceae bacterium]
MDYLIIPGVIIALLGVAGLGYCIFQANKLRHSGLEGEELVGKLSTLIPINLASVFVATIGLAAVVIGILL